MSSDNSFGIRPQVCPECPFTTSSKGACLGAGLDQSRRDQIADELEQGTSFVCHMESHGSASKGPASSARHCTGAAVVMDRQGTPTETMRLAVALREPEFQRTPAVPWQTARDWAEQVGF